MEKYGRGAAGGKWQYGACALIAGYLRLQIHTLTLSNDNCFSTANVVAGTRLSVTLHVLYIACTVINCLRVLSIVLSRFSEFRRFETLFSPSRYAAGEVVSLLGIEFCSTIYSISVCTRAFQAICTFF
jgi:hypothetical protein